MDTIEARFRGLLRGRPDLIMMVFLVQRRTMAIEFICDGRAAGFNVVIDKSFQ